MLKAGVQVVGLNRIEGALSRIRQTLTRVVQDQAVNLVHFWIPENRNAETERKLWIASRVAEECQRM